MCNRGVNCERASETTAERLAVILDPELLLSTKTPNWARKERFVSHEHEILIFLYFECPTPNDQSR
jgi:hypothetical protein